MNNSSHYDGDLPNSNKSSVKFFFYMHHLLTCFLLILIVLLCTILFDSICSTLLCTKSTPPCSAPFCYIICILMILPSYVSMYTMTVFKDEKKDFLEWNALYGLLLKSKTQAVVKKVIDKVSGEHLILLLVPRVPYTMHCVLCTRRWCGMQGLGSIDVLYLHCLDIHSTIL